MFIDVVCTQSRHGETSYQATNFAPQKGSPSPSAWTDKVKRLTSYIQRPTPGGSSNSMGVVLFTAGADGAGGNTTGANPDPDMGTDLVSRDETAAPPTC